MNVFKWVYRAVKTVNVGTHKGEDIDLAYTYTGKANPNATNSELDAKKIIYHNREDHADL
tara:strand:+ start:785 stop:964 length:180 start_codon:yes stop_codon:yes gene_type:complete